MEAMGILQSTIRIWPRQTLAGKDLMAKSDMELGTLDSQLCSLNGAFTKIGAAKGKASLRKSDTPLAPTPRRTTSIAHCS
jgi:hypothetical protein